jgi:heme oxygenase
VGAIVFDRLLHALREATASRHAELDQSLALTAPGLTMERHVAFLREALLRHAVHAVH